MPLKLFNVHAEESLAPISLLGACIELLIIGVIVLIFCKYWLVYCPKSRLNCATVVRSWHVLCLSRLDSTHRVERATITVTAAHLMHLKEANLLPLTDLLNSTQCAACWTRLATSLLDYLANLNCLLIFYNWVVVVLLRRDGSGIPNNL